MTKTLKPFVRDEHGHYTVSRPVQSEEIIEEAIKLATAKLRRGREVLSSPSIVRDYIALTIGVQEKEIFWGIFLDNRHRVITHEILSTGTIDSSAVYPREIVKAALACNATAILFAHNHPSGVPEPSDTDVRLTKKLTDALAIVDIRVLDHLIVGTDNITSLAERGLM